MPSPSVEKLMLELLWRKFELLITIYNDTIFVSKDL